MGGRVEIEDTMRGGQGAEEQGEGHWDSTRIRNVKEANDDSNTYKENVKEDNYNDDVHSNNLNI